MEKNLDIIIVGRVTIDFNPLDYYNTLDNNAKFAKYVGGSAGNTAIGLARHHNKVGFVGKISSDQFGAYIERIMHEEKVDTTYLLKDPHARTGLTFTQMESEEKSSILMYRDQVADLNLLPEEINAQYLKQARIVVLSGTTFSDSPAREALLKAMIIAKENGSEIVFDIDYRPYGWKSSEETSVIYHLAAKYSDIIVGSIDEFRLASKFILPDVSTASDEEIAQAWLKTTKIVIIKNGKEGSKCFTHDKRYAVKIFPIKLLKSFGGGDAYMALFLNGYLKNPQDLKAALIDATCAASYMVQSHASYTHPDEKTLRPFVKKALHDIPDLVKEF